MAFANDSKQYMAAAIEPTYATPSPYVLTISGTPSGTFLLSYRGVATATITATALFSAINSAMATAWAAYVTAGATFTAAGTIASGITITIAGGNAAAYELSADFTATTASTKTLTGGPAYVMMRDSKFEFTDDVNIKVTPSQRNSRYPHYTDTIVVGGQKAEFTLDMPMYADQLPILLVAAGFTDSVATINVAVGQHTLKATTTNGKSLSLQYYDGQVTHVAIGGVITEVKLDMKGGTGAMTSVAVKGWCFLGDRATETITRSAPSDTTYRALAPTTTGYAFTIGGASFNLCEQSVYTWDNSNTPFYTKINGKTPYRPEYKEWGLKATAHTMIEDVGSGGSSVAEFEKLYVATPLTYAVVETIAGQYTIPSSSPATVDSVVFTTAANLYTKIKTSYGFGAPKVTLDGSGLYNAGAASDFGIVICNDRLTVY